MIDTLPQVGRVEWIGLRPRKGADLQSVDTVRADADQGLVGDHYHGRSGKRHVTLIQAEHLHAMGGMLGREQAVDPGQTRRNIVVSGINLLAFNKRRFRIGDVILEMTGPCDPCSRMETNLGPGGYNAMRGHGGICAKVIASGNISVGDEVRLEIGN